MKLPPNSAISGYQLFMKETLLSTSGPGVPGRFTAAAAQWKALSDAEKQVYRHSPFRLASLHVLRRC
jgi:hypothetical protein